MNHRVIPRTVTIAIALTVVSAVVAAARTAAVLVIVDGALVGSLMTLVVVALLIASAVAFARAQPWARLPVMVWSVISAVSSATTLLLGVEPWWYLLSAGVTLACAVGLLVALTRPESREWFGVQG
ncbi:MAG: hypothetical protein EOO74_03170 [Myxococcales bacterium]|nr:MAG: hypothetical protein EOO74_03170 [Myxococcales bacterium]